MARRLGVALSNLLLGKPPANDWFQTVTERFNIYRGPLDPTTAEVPENQWIVHENTTTNRLGLWANDNGSMLNLVFTPGEVFPVGYVFMSVSSTNPASLLGFGTWTSFGAGRVLVGLDAGDPDFDTAEETGGAKTKAISAHSGTAVAAHASHTHDYTDVPDHVHPQQAQGDTTADVLGTHVMTSVVTGGALRTTEDTETNTGGVATGTTLGPDAPLTHSVTQPDNHTNLNVVQPYIVVYMWKRTA